MPGLVCAESVLEFPLKIAELVQTSPVTLQ